MELLGNHIYWDNPTENKQNTTDEFKRIDHDLMGALNRI